MVAFVKKVVNVGAVPNDDTGDTLRQGGIDINDNYTAIFDQTAYEIGGSLAVTYGPTGNSAFSGDAIIATKNLMVGKTAVDFGATAGAEIRADGRIAAGRVGETLILNRLTSDGDVALFRKDGTTIGGIGVESGKLVISSGAGTITAIAVDSSQNLVLTGDVDPAVTEIQDIGSVTFEWDNIFLQNAPTVSDERRKNDLGPVDDKLIELMRRIDPRIFSRKTRVVKEAVPERTELRPKTKMVMVDKVQTKIIDGVPIRQTTKVKQQEPVGKMVQIMDENGKAVPDKIIAAIIDKSGNIVRPEQTVAQLAFVPEMEDVVIPAELEIVAEHGRPHTGFMAQKIKQLMDELGIEDWAGYAYHNDEGEDIHVLRLLEFIAPILALAQDSDKRIKVLE